MNLSFLMSCEIISFVRQNSLFLFFQLFTAFKLNARDNLFSFVLVISK